PFWSRHTLPKSVARRFESDRWFQKLYRHRQGGPMEMDPQLSPWWRRALILLIISGFSALGYLAVRTYHDAPPSPARVIGPDGATLFTRQDVIAGQQIFLSHGLMENGSIWGHGAYLGPDFSAEYLHTMALGIRASAPAASGQNSGGPHPS